MKRVETEMSDMGKLVALAAQEAHAAAKAAWEAAESRYMQRLQEAARADGAEIGRDLLAIEADLQNQRWFVVTKDEPAEGEPEQPPAPTDNGDQVNRLAASTRGRGV